MVHKQHYPNYGAQIRDFLKFITQQMVLLPGLIGTFLLFSTQPIFAQNGNLSCQTAWAWNESSLCINEVCPGSDKWGFTTQSDPSGEPQRDQFDIIEAGPGICFGSGSEGEDVGDIIITWSDPPVIQIQLDGHVLREVHVWLGCTPLPVQGSNCNPSPGKFGCKYKLQQPESSFIIDDCLGECPEGTTWIAIHLVTCDDEGPGESLVRLENYPIMAQEEKSMEPIEVSAFPNPATDAIHIEIDGPVVDDVEITLLNQFGKVVRSMTSNVLSGEQLSVEITEDLPDGIYYLRVGNQVTVELTKVLIMRQE